MSENEPLPTVNPVGFGPPPSPDSVGLIGPPAERPPMEFSVFIPLAILMLTLICGVVRDMITLNKRMADINDQNAPYLELLKKSAKQMQLADSLRLGIVKLAATDPVAANIAKDYFPAPPAATTPAAPAKPTDSSGTSKPSGN